MNQKVKIGVGAVAIIFLIVLLRFGQKISKENERENTPTPSAGSSVEIVAPSSSLGLPEGKILEKNVLNFSGNKLSEGSATLSWNANSEPDLAGYRIYYGPEPRTGNCPPGGYLKKIDAGSRISYTINNLEIGKTYYFSLVSYDKSGNESCFSQEGKKIIK